MEPQSLDLRKLLVSEVLEPLSALRDGAGLNPSAPSKLRSLRKDEVDDLERRGNSCADWSQVEIAQGCDLGLVRNCTLRGFVLIGPLVKSKPVPGARGLPVGLYNSTLENCVIVGNARVSNAELVQNTVIGEGVLISKCGFIVKDSRGAFGNGISIPVAIGSGGREVVAFAHLDLEQAAKIAANRGDKVLQETHAKAVDLFVERVNSIFNIIDTCASLECVALLSNAYVGPYARVENSHVENVTILSSKEEPSMILAGSDVRNAILQYNVHVDSGSHVENALMITCSHAERRGILMDSIIGPYSGVAEGEISSSLVGPFVGFHHQALLIASYWPAGRGNIGYGANVGSNHTGKAPDQELWHGEGLFYGLSSSVKFPSDFSHAPYSLVATGVTTLPQRVTMPFSLISAPSQSFPHLSSAINEIFPGWILSQNIYSVLRNEHKFKTRGGKSKRVSIDFRIFRPLTVAMIRKARDQLASTAMPQKDIYTDKDFPGIGKNYMTHAARKEAIETYTYFLLYYAVLQGLWARLESADPSQVVQVALEAANEIDRAEVSYDAVEPSADYTFTGSLSYGSSATSRRDDDAVSEWKLQCSIIRNEGKRVVGIEPNPHTTTQLEKIVLLLEWLKVAKQSIAKSAQESKMKDEVRGAKIIPGYIEAHGSVLTDDSLVKREISDAAAFGERVGACVAILSKASNLSHAKL